MSRSIKYLLGYTICTYSQPGELRQMVAANEAIIDFPWPPGTDNRTLLPSRSCNTPIAEVTVWIFLRFFPPLPVLYLCLRSITSSSRWSNLVRLPVTSKRLSLATSMLCVLFMQSNVLISSGTSATSTVTVNVAKAFEIGDVSALTCSVKWLASSFTFYSFIRETFPWNSLNYLNVKRSAAESTRKFCIRSMS